MKTTIKIVILLLAVTCAIGGVMIYAKTRVAPPVASSYSRIQIFAQEGKVQPSDADKSLDKFVGSYTPKFLKRCFDLFKKSEWRDEDHNYIISQSSFLKGLKHSDSTPVLSKSTLDSLILATSIINEYRDARRISRVSSFTGYDNARASISKARTYAKNPYLANCHSLLNELNSVSSRLASSCYRQVVAEVEKLGNYTYYTKSYYEGTLVPHVDQVVTNYDNKASAIFGTKESVDALWKRAQGYVNRAMEYYGDE